MGEGLRTLRVVVDEGLCDSYGVCVSIAPSMFWIDDDDVMRVRAPSIPADDIALVRQAVESCPRQALSIVELREKSDPTPRSNCEPQGGRL